VPHNEVDDPALSGAIRFNLQGIYSFLPKIDYFLPKILQENTVLTAGDAARGNSREGSN
jgi:hypothetical protein